MGGTSFGLGCENDGQSKYYSHAVLDDERFSSIPYVKQNNLRDKAIKQLGTSGGGNHFVEFGVVEIDGKEHVAILTHSGSRGVGANIANFYTRVAMENCKLPKEAARLAFLDLDSEEGQEYWEAMNLSGDFASACHHTIHDRLAKELKLDRLGQIENHHNFAWKETLNDGREVIVHRKGATPAGEGQLGIIPGSMTTNTYIVKGKGNSDSINSVSHGAGRAMSRKAAKESYTKSAMKKDLADKGVTLIGGAVDECTFAYKNIDDVMARQGDLVDIIGAFMPKIVRMAAD
jgi:tRNA-splicing ligase RtcB